MMDWTSLVRNLLKMNPKRLPRDCMLQGYKFASLTIAWPVSATSRRSLRASRVPHDDLQRVGRHGEAGDLDPQVEPGVVALSHGVCLILI